MQDAPHPRETHSFIGHAEAEQNLLRALFGRDICRRPSSLAEPPGIGKATLGLAACTVSFGESGSCRCRWRHEDGSFCATRHIRFRVKSSQWRTRISFSCGASGMMKTKKHFTQIRVEDVRRAIHMFQQAAGRGGYRICILDCAEDLNQNSANALLKLIEEPPPRSLFLIIAQRPGRVLATLRSRCQKILLRPLAAADIDAIVAALGPPWSSAGDAKLAAASRGRAVPSIMPCGSSTTRESSWTQISAGCWMICLTLIGARSMPWPIGSRRATTAAITRRCSPRSRIGSMHRVRHGARTLQGACARRLAPYALVWEKLERGGARDRNLQSRQAASCSVPFRRSGGGGTGFSFLTRSEAAAVMRGSARSFEIADP